MGKDKQINAGFKRRCLKNERTHPFVVPAQKGRAQLVTREHWDLAEEGKMRR